MADDWNDPKELVEMLVHAIVRRETNLWASEFESAGIRIIRVVGTINGVEKRDEKSVLVSSRGAENIELTLV